MHSRFYLKKHLEARDSSIISRTRCLQRYQHHFSNFALVRRGREGKGEGGNRSKPSYSREGRRGNRHTQVHHHPCPYKA